MRDDEIPRHLSTSVMNLDRRWQRSFSEPSRDPSRRGIHPALGATPFYSLPNCPQQVGRHGRSQEAGAIAQDGDELGQMLQLQPIVQRVPEAMGPMEERQGDEDEEVEPYHRMCQRAGSRYR